MGKPMQTYSATLVTVTFNGVVIEGFDEDDMVEITRNNPSSELVKGAKGENSRYLTNDKSGVIKIFTQQDSTAFAVLKALLNIDEATGLGVGTLMVAYPLAGEVFVANEAFIAKMPDVKFGKGLNAREWEFTCPDLEYK